MCPILRSIICSFLNWSTWFKEPIKLVDTNYNEIWWIKFGLSPIGWMELYRNACYVVQFWEILAKLWVGAPFGVSTPCLPSGKSLIHHWVSRNGSLCIILSGAWRVEGVENPLSDDSGFSCRQCHQPGSQPPMWGHQPMVLTNFP